MNPFDRLKSENFDIPEAQSDMTMIIGKYIEEFAQAAHEFYLLKMKEVGNEGHPSMVDWADLPQELKESNRNQVRSVIEKMNTSGFTLDEGPTLLNMAQAEHNRYVYEKIAGGWTHEYLKYGTGLAQQSAGEKWHEMSKNERKVLAIKLMRENHKNHLLIPWKKLSNADKQKNFDAIDFMVTYVQIKRIALGFDLLKDSPEKHTAAEGKSEVAQHRHFEKLSKKEFDEQSKLKEKLSFRWDTEYATDRESSRKNFEKLNGYLLAGDRDKTIQLFVQKPAADWLNYVFLDVTEVNDLINVIKNATSECREVVSVAVTKELERLVNFKTLFELICKKSQTR